MWYIYPEPTENGAYGNPMSNQSEGMLALPDELLGDYIAAKGFVLLTVVDGTITALETNTAALEAYEAEHPDVEPEPATEPEYVTYDALAAAYDEGVMSIDE